MRKIITFITFILLGFLAFSQNTSPLVVKDFVLKSNEIIDLEQIPKFNRTDLDNNPICRIKVKAQGFEEGVLQKFVFVPNGIEITHMVFKDGQWLLHVSSQKSGGITIKYMGDCVFRLPYQLEPSKVYEMTLGMETATLVIRTVPTEAEIFIDNEKVGSGEAIKAVSIGAEHRYRVVCENYYTKEGVVQFSKREEKSINVELESNFGYITIKSEPSGADIYIDDVKVGITPYLMKSIKLGNHVVELRKNGFEIYADMVTIQIGELNRQLENVKLEASEAKYGILDISSEPSNAIIIINGRQYGTTPNTLENFEVGTYTIKFTKEGYDELVQTVDVMEGKTETLDVILIKKSVQQQKNHQQQYSTYAQKLLEKKNDAFSVSEDQQVYISKGNLQYQASTKTWRFAENPWDFVGEDNDKISPNYNGWIDLFGWGTGDNPTKCTDNNTDYDEFHDWGENVISNGESYKWRVLSTEELNYLFFYRNTLYNVRFVKAIVNNIKGIIFFPDCWNPKTYSFKYLNHTASAYNSNIVSVSDWKTLETSGAVFIPVTGSRRGTKLKAIGKGGYYWTSTGVVKGKATALYFQPFFAIMLPNDNRSDGHTVRLVRNVE